MIATCASNYDMPSDKELSLFVNRITPNGKLSKKVIAKTNQVDQPTVDTTEAQKSFLNKCLLQQMHWSHLQAISDKFLATSQSEDETYRQITEKILAGRKVKTFEMHKDLLFKVTNKHPAGLKILRLCLSDSMTETICKRMHTNLQYHFSARALSNMFNSLFYNANVLNILNRVEKNCAHCILLQPNKFKNIIGSERSFINDIKPGSHWSIDSLQLTRSKNGYMYILLLVEEFSGYVIATPLKTLQANETVTALRIIFGHLPIPKVIRSDNATQFSNQQVRDFMSSTGIEHVFSVPLRPQSNGRAENSVKQIKRLLNKAILHFGTTGRSNWDIVLPQCIATLNSYNPPGSTMSRQNLCFNPHFIGYIRTIQYNQELFSPTLYSLQQTEGYKRMSERRKKLLAMSDIAKPSKSQSMIVPGAYCIINRKPEELVLDKNHTSALTLKANKILKYWK